MLVLGTQIKQTLAQSCQTSELVGSLAEYVILYDMDKVMAVVRMGRACLHRGSRGAQAKAAGG